MPVQKTKKAAKPKKALKEKGAELELPKKKAEKLEIEATLIPEPAIDKEKLEETDENSAAFLSQSERYWEAVGRRKTAVARARLFTRGEKGVWVHEKPVQTYFQQDRLVSIIEEPLKKMKSTDRFRVTIKVSGGGMNAQAEAARHAISRALVKFNPDFRKRLKRAGFLKRDPRMKERKKFGLKGARKAPQWAKR
ncbi:MAG: 30S ribosomal protein S9 [Candidatus Sungbacteria bacterium]|nr:30S ribosomal protein S9 [Candidatus Sungbacteria bacterium]